MTHLNDVQVYPSATSEHHFISTDDPEDNLLTLTEEQLMDLFIVLGTYIRQNLQYSEEYKKRFIN